MNYLHKSKFWKQSNTIKGENLQNLCKISDSKHSKLSDGKNTSWMLKTTMLETTKLVEVLQYFVSHCPFTRKDDWYVHIKEICSVLACQFILLRNGTVLTVEQIRKNIFACLFIIHNTIIYSILKCTHLENFFHHINNLHQNIKFTMEEESNGELAFLDTLLKRNNGEISVLVYRKPTHTD